MINHPNRGKKIIEAEDAIAEARGCIWAAASDLTRALKKTDEAMAMLIKYRTNLEFGKDKAS